MLTAQEFSLISNPRLLLTSAYTLRCLSTRERIALAVARMLSIFQLC